MSEESTSLYFRQGTSDKVYHVDLVATGEGKFLVNTRWGARSAQKLRSGTKTPRPLPYDEATARYHELVKEKLSEGYTPSESGAPYQGAPMGARVSGVVPQLLNAVDDAGLETLLLDDGYAMQPKHNGERRLVRVSGAVVEGINRKGLVVELPGTVAEAAATIGLNCIVDGELVVHTLHAFDLLEHDGISIREKPFGERYRLLEAILSKPPLRRGSSAIQLVETALGQESKRKLLARVKAANGEGVVLKLLNSPYEPGRPNTGGTQLKYPFYATATCRVSSHHGAKRSVSIEVVGHDQWVAVGNVMIPPNHAMPAIGALCEVRYLYAYPGGSLVQPVFEGERRDLAENDAKIEQLKYRPRAEGDEE